MNDHLSGEDPVDEVRGTSDGRGGLNPDPVRADRPRVTGRTGLIPAARSAALGPAVMILVSVLTGAPMLVLPKPWDGWYDLFGSTLAAYLAAGTAICSTRPNRSTHPGRPAHAGRLPGQTTPSRAQVGWVLLGVGCFGWGAGNTYWTWSELVVHAQVLFPSWADLGFLTFPVAATVGLWLILAGTSRSLRMSSVLDGLIFTGSLLAISWTVTLRATYQAGGDSPFALIVSLAYPCGDLVLAMMGFLLATRTRRGGRGVISLLILGLLGMTVSDTLFALAQANGTYATGDFSDAGWIVGFVALAFAARLAVRQPLTLVDDGIQRQWQLLLPYFPFGAALLITVVQVGGRQTLDLFQAITLLVVLLLVMARQLLTLTHNSALTRQLHHQAFHDGLTGLANRAFFTSRLEGALTQRAQGGPQVVVLCLDLDDFKIVNDTQGHDAGDAVLQVVAQRLLACFQPGDTVARLGGDEFAVIVQGDATPEAQAGKILQALQEPFAINAGSVSASIGATTTAALPPHGRLNPADLMKQVDLALYAAKGRGKRNFAVYEPIMWHNFDEEMLLRTRLGNALQQGALTIVHQPIHDLRSRRIVGVEALARWSDGTLGDVPPATFIPVAERAHLIAPIGEFVLNRACQEFSRWSAGSDTYLSVNVSPLQLLDPSFLEMATTTVYQHGLHPRQLVLEVTENALAEESKIAIVLSLLRQEGFRIAIDDFGTGYASLRYLHQFPADIIKIDRSYVQDIEHDEAAARLLRAVVQMIATLGLTCIAEGTETEEQAIQLTDLGCRFSQGYLFSRPMPVAMLPSLRPASPVTAPGR